MRSRIILIVILILCLKNQGHTQVQIDIQISGKPVMIKYYEPFKGFANRDVATQVPFEVMGNFKLLFDIDVPTFVQLTIASNSFELFCEPGDTINLLYGETPESVEVIGKNSVGNLFYNNVFNKVRFSKYEGLRNLFLTSSNKSTELLISEIDWEFSKKTAWIDSLFNIGKVSSEFVSSMKMNVNALLAWETVQLCDKYFEKINPDLFLTGTAIKADRFKKVNPLDPKLKTCLSGSAYYYVFFSEKYRTNKIIDSTLVINPDVPFYALAPLDIQGFLWGKTIYANRLFSPEKHDYCAMFNKYVTLFRDGPYVDYLRQSNICADVGKAKIKIIEPSGSDLFSFLSDYFQGRRVLIDLWATWCAPCKIEFKYYDDSFYSFMKERNIELLFISIDKQTQKEKWLEDVKHLNLNGTHALSDTSLLNSIKEIAFDGGSFVIPRYILIDDNGRILSINFNRPSDPLFKNEIKKFFPSN